MPPTDPTESTPRHFLNPEEIDRVGDAIMLAGNAGSLTLVNARRSDTGEMHTLLAVCVPSPDGNGGVLGVAGRIFGPDEIVAYDSPLREDNEPAPDSSFLAP